MSDDILLFFNVHTEILPAYEKLEQRIREELGDVHIKVSKTQIGFSNKYGFAYVSFNPCRRGKDRPKNWMTVSFGLGYPLRSARVDAAVEPYPGRWTHHVMVGSAEEIDDELLGWICEAAVFAATKR